MKKLAIINRGVPGSGKSTFTKVMKELSDKEGLLISIHSTDDKHMVDGVYKWDMKKVGQYHKQNLNEFTKSLKDSVNIVICDNTNIKMKDFNKYLTAAREHNYVVIAVTFAPDDLQKHFERNTHSVPMETIELMAKRLSSNLVTDMFDREIIIYPDKFSKSKIINVANSIISR